MNIGQRIKVLRKEYLHLNQTDFATPLGLTQAAIGAYENELRNVSEPSILAICRVYGVREQWLRSGEGDIFHSSAISCSIISELVQEYDLDLMDQHLIAEYLKLDKPSRSILKNYIKKVFLTAENKSPHTEQTPNDLFYGIPKTSEELEAAFPPIDIHADVG